MLVNSLLGHSVETNSHRFTQSLTSPLFWNLNENLNFYSCTVEYINSNAKAIYIYIWLGIRRCDGPERHEMLTVISAYYGYYGILQICPIFALI